MSIFIKKSLKADRIFLIYILVLIVFGLVALTSASTPVGYEKFGDAYHFFKRQVFRGLIPGLVLFLIVAKINYKWFKRMSWIIYGVAIALLVLVFIPGIGFELNGAHSWIAIGPFNFQPSEFAKFAIIVMGANLLSDGRRDMSDWQTGLLPVLAILAPACLLVLLQPDIGTLSILVVIIFAMLYLGRVSWKYLSVLGMFAVIAFGAMVMVAPYRLQRFTTFLHPEIDPLGVGYQINQSFLAIGSGGPWGLGLGHSRQKYQYLPEVTSDSIFAVVAEEVGFIISSLIVLLILLIGWRGLKIAKNAPDGFSRLLVGGLVVWIVWQSFLNTGAIVGVLPLTGVPFPFVSYGGSAYVMSMIAVGIVVNISRFSNK